jgi:hypothetical protein
MSNRLIRAACCAYPPLEGEGRIAPGDPGWGDPYGLSTHPHPTAFASLKRSTSPLQGEVGATARGDA